MPCRCEYIDCEVQRVHYPHIRMYSFPTNDDIRLEKWKINCGNTIHFHSYILIAYFFVY